VQLLTDMDLFEEVGFQMDLVHEPSEAVVDIGAHVEHAQSIRIELFHRIGAAEAKFKYTATLFR